MKIDRLIGIITVLLRNKKVTAPYLAEKFEVSRRTISRDIEDICKAGIPVVTEQGYNGGIYIAEGYKIDKTLLTAEELQAIFIGLKGIDSVSAVPRSSVLADKLSLKNNAVFLAHDHILIDLASHYKGSLTEKIEQLRLAIAEQYIVTFDYYYSKGESERLIEPYLLVFKWSAWYVFGFCAMRQDFRMFKLNRLWNLQTTDEIFSPRLISQENLDFGNCWTVEIKLTALFDKSVKYRLIDDRGIDSYTITEDGRLLLESNYTNYDNLLEWVLSFGNKVEVLEPESLRNDLAEQAEKILKYYQGT